MTELEFRRANSIPLPRLSAELTRSARLRTALGREEIAAAEAKEKTENKKP